MRATGAVFAAAALVFAGCFSVDVATSPVLGEEVESHATARNYGWYLFGVLPVVCGNERLDSWCPISFFHDEVNPMTAHDKIKDLAVRGGYEISNFHMIYDDDVMFSVYNVPVPIPWVVVRKEVCLSVCLVKRGGAR